MPKKQELGLSFDFSLDLAEQAERISVDDEGVGIGFAPSRLVDGVVMRGEEFRGRVFDTGASPFGWSKQSSFMTCPYLYGRRHVEPLSKEELASTAPRWANSGMDKATSLGSTGHAAMASQLAIWGARQGGVVAADELIDDEKQIAPPLEAIEVVAKKEGVSVAGRDSIIAAFKSWLQENPQPAGRVVSVESSIEAVVGLKETDAGFTDFGLWVVKSLKSTRPDGYLVAIDDRLVKPKIMTGMPKIRYGSAEQIGKPNPLEGTRIIATRRMDASVGSEGLSRLITSVSSQAEFMQRIRDSQGRLGFVDIEDHKFSKLPFGPAKVKHYEMDAQFQWCRTMGQQVYGRAFGKTMLNAIHRMEPYTHGRAEMPPLATDSQCASQIVMWRRQIAMAFSTADVKFWPRNLKENVCRNDFGDCELYYHCRNGQ